MINLDLFISPGITYLEYVVGLFVTQATQNQ